MNLFANHRVRAIAGAAFVLFASSGALADQPGRGLTAQFEIEFMQMTIDHHFAALRMTELAAGTDATRDAAIQSEEGTSPTPGFARVERKSSMEELKSLARRNNRMQREEIMTLKRFLREWYRVDYQPKVTAPAQAMISTLEQARPGADFDHTFLEVFSRHHYTLLQPLNGCLSGADIQHEDLQRECRMMWHGQTGDIAMMRHQLNKKFGIADYQPFQDKNPLQPDSTAPKGQHSGGEPQT
jgi:uncharacterized protein (DUF305 family)